MTLARSVTPSTPPLLTTALLEFWVESDIRTYDLRGLENSPEPNIYVYRPPVGGGQNTGLSQAPAR